MTQRILFSWSSGKDSVMALYELSKNRDCEIASLLTTITEDYRRISMHGVREELLDLQAESLGMKLEKVYITKNADNEEYGRKMQAMLVKYKELGVSGVAFGDIFLEDLKKYREDNLAKVEMTGLFPIWKRDTAELSRTFIRLGFKAVITCVDSNVLDGKFAGRLYDEQFLAELPGGIDPCGENGEFHSFVYDGPVFRQPLHVKIGEVEVRENRFYFCDVIPADKE